MKEYKAFFHMIEGGRKVLKHIELDATSPSGAIAIVKAEAEMYHLVPVGAIMIVEKETNENNRENSSTT